MKKLLAILWLTVSFAQAQDQTTANLITNQWSGIQTMGSVPSGCATAGPCPGGPGAMYDPNTNTIHFSYGLATVAQTFAINQALANAGTGIQVKGYNYSWDINNLNGDNRQGSTDTLTASIITYNGTNTAIRRTDTWVYNTKFDWTTFGGEVNYAAAGPVSDFGNLTVKFTGMDSGYWGGYFGPKVRNVDIRIRYGFDACVSDPLSSPSCSGYATAYLNLQCSGNPLYSPSCPGYAQAFFTQQCTVNALSDPSCPGYANAYLNYQCSINPLYATTCSGYETAYFNQQCSTNPLYNSRCPGYEQAYFTQQCNANGLYSTSCPNYATAYAKRMLLEQKGLASTVSTAGVVAKTAEVANANISSTSSSDGSSSVAVAVVADPVVNAAVTSTATSTSPAAAATATVSLAPAPTAELKPVAVEAKPAGAPAPSAPQGDKPAQPSARQALAERRAEAAKKDAVDKGKNLANEMGKAADMESQKQVQNVVIQAMGFTPGFDTYGKVLVPDGVIYKPFTVYNGQVNVDNRRLGMGMYGPSDRLHNEMVGAQYKGN